MKVITIKQPFATLIAEGYKEYEFRTWRTHYRGDILIHAGKGTDQKAMKRFAYLGLEYPVGCIIAKAEITDCLLVDRFMREELKQKDPIVYHGVVAHPDWGGYGFKLENVQKIEPIAINGKLSLWNYPKEEEIKYL